MDLYRHQSIGYASCEGKQVVYSKRVGAYCHLWMKANRFVTQLSLGIIVLKNRLLELCLLEKRYGFFELELVV